MATCQGHLFLSETFVFFVTITVLQASDWFGREKLLKMGISSNLSVYPSQYPDW